MKVDNFNLSTTGNNITHSESFSISYFWKHATSLNINSFYAKSTSQKIYLIALTFVFVVLVSSIAYRKIKAHFNKVKVSVADKAKVSVVLPDSIRKKILSEVLSQPNREKINAGMKKEYDSLVEKFSLPSPLMGHHPYVPAHFTMLMPGIALVATLLKQKFNLENFWICANLQSFNNKLNEINENPRDQRHAFVVPIENEAGREGHKISICIEKNNGHLAIYVMAPEEYCDNIKLKNQKLNTTKVYFVEVIRQSYEVDGCSVFALRDCLYFLRDIDFTKKIGINELPARSNNLTVPVFCITRLPAESMQLTQSMRKINEYITKFPTFASLPFGPFSRTLQANVNKNTVSVNGIPQNHTVVRAVYRYQQFILEALRTKTAEEIESLVKNSLI